MGLEPTHFKCSAGAITLPVWDWLPILHPVMMARILGVEPRPAVLETAALPLRHIRIGVSAGGRTRDLVYGKHALYQLSYADSVVASVGIGFAAQANHRSLITWPIE